MADPFGSQVREPHPALGDHYRLPADLYRPLMNNFLQDEKYKHWSQGYKPWQLHCFGSPGCGKTTFAALAVEDLQTKFQRSGVRIASLFLRDVVIEEHPSFIEDLLACVYSQLAEDFSEGEERAGQLPRDYEKACLNGASLADRLHVLRSALRDLFRSNKHNFLVLDGWDLLDSTTQLLLEHEFGDSHPRNLNLSLLITRCLPAFQKPGTAQASCNRCDDDVVLDMYWQCPGCKALDTTYCYECKAGGAICENEGHDTLTLNEPYSHLDLDISTIGGASYTELERYVVREIKQFASTSVSDVFNDRIACTLATSIVQKSEGNINKAKIRLDELYSVGLETSDAVLNRLPRSIIAFYDSEIARFKLRGAALEELAVFSIAAVHVGQQDRSGITLEHLAGLIEKGLGGTTLLKQHPIRSLEQILDAAKGLIVMQANTDAILLALYHPDLSWYVEDDYNEELYRAKNKLQSLTVQKDDTITTGFQSREEQVAAASVSAPATMVSERFSSENQTENAGTGVDSGYVSRDLSRHTSTESNVPTLSNAKLTSVVEDDLKEVTARVQSLTVSKPCLSSENSALIEEQKDMNGKLNQGLCSFCQEHIVDSSETQGTHHVSIQSLLEVLNDAPRCSFCIELYANILFPQSALQTVAHAEWSHYTWSVQTTGRTRNSESSLTVTFRPTDSGSVNANRESMPASKRFHVLSEKDLGSLPSGTDLGHTTKPTQISNLSKLSTPTRAGKQLLSWIKTCNETHPHCANLASSAFIPLHLVDLECSDRSMIRIVNTLTEKIRSHYGTLSHSWGPARFLTLTKDNEAELMGPGIKLSRLSRNFREAIEVSRFIGLRYIWINSLCIRQGIGGDFHEQGQLMHKVYTNSYCNLAIADSADGEGGLFRMRNPADIVPPLYNSNGAGKLDAGRWRILSEQFWERELLGTKIYTRGWVFQERMLSPRILHFAASQIFWDCGTLSACETLPDGLPHALDAVASTDRHWRARIQIAQAIQNTESTSNTRLLSNQSSQTTPPTAVIEGKRRRPLVGAIDSSMETFWRTALHAYTSCALTNQSDKTLAIWSIAKIARDALREEYGTEEYGAGMWERGLEEQLAWRKERPGAEEVRVEELQVENPSWSWASVKGAVVPKDRLTRRRFYSVTNWDGGVIGFKLRDYGENRDAEPRLADGGLELCGYVGKCVIKRAEGQVGGFEMRILRSKAVDGKREVEGGDWHAFPDEPIEEGDGRKFDFIILAATALSSRNNKLPLEDPDDVEEGEEISFSGSALLLTSHLEYREQQLSRLMMASEELVDATLEPDGLGTMDNLRLKKAKDAWTVVELLASNEKKSDRSIDTERWYRRAGAVQFQNVERGVWEGLKSEGRAKILLD